MKIELDERGFRIEIIWKSLKNLIRVLIPLAAALVGFLTAPELSKLATLIGLW